MTAIFFLFYSGENIDRHCHHFDEYDLTSIFQGKKDDGIFPASPVRQCEFMDVEIKPGSEEKFQSQPTSKWIINWKRIIHKFAQSFGCPHRGWSDHVCFRGGWPALAERGGLRWVEFIKNLCSSVFWGNVIRYCEAAWKTHKYEKCR